MRLRVGAVAAETCLAATVGRWLAHARSYAMACFARAGVAQAENASCDAEGGEPRYKPPEPDKMAPGLGECLSRACGRFARTYGVLYDIACAFKRLGLLKRPFCSVELLVGYQEVLGRAVVCRGLEREDGFLVDGEFRDGPVHRVRFRIVRAAVRGRDAALDIGGSFGNAVADPDAMRCLGCARSGVPYRKRVANRVVSVDWLRPFC